MGMIKKPSMAGKRKILSVVMSLTLLSACASQPVEITHYTLPVDAAPASRSHAQPVFLTLSIDSSDLLAGPGIVYQTSELELDTAYSHRWADSLWTQLRQSLQATLLASYPGYRFIGEPVEEYGYSVRVVLDRFQGRYDGYAVISGQWLIRTADGRYLAGRPFQVTKALSADGYPALVRSLATGWQEVGLTIASQLAEIRGN